MFNAESIPDARRRPADTHYGAAIARDWWVASGSRFAVKMTNHRYIA